MAEWIFGPIEGMIEPSIAPEFFITDIGGLELIGNNNIRVHYCVEQLSMDPGGDTLRITKVKIVRPVSTIPKALVRLAAAQCRILGYDAPEINLQGPWPRLVR